MGKKLVLLSFLLSFLSCNTINTKSNKTDSVNNELINENTLSVEDMAEDFITTDSIKSYDLTVLKGGSYPEIKNDTPFTINELQILKHSEGLELEATVEVAHYFKYFLRDKKELLELWIENARPVIPLIRQSFLENSLPEDLIYLPFLESGYNVNAYSRVGAGGMWQFMPKTAVSYGLKINWWTDERRSPQLATPYAIEHLIYLNNLFDNWYTALAAYNAGEGRITRAMKKVDTYDYFELIKTDALPRETKKYVPQYLAILKIMKNLSSLGFTDFNWDIEEQTVEFEIPGGTDLFELSTNLGVTWKLFTTLNPSYRRNVSDPSHKSIVRIPLSTHLAAIDYLKSHKPIISNKEFTYYTVKSGDSWWYLSNLTNRTVLSLKRLNSINSNNLRIGQRILLPGLNYQEEKKDTFISQGTTLQTYRVKDGDTISNISIKYNIKLSSLYSENNLNSHSILKIGQIIRLPGYPVSNVQKASTNTLSTKYYTVKSGDSVWIIAKKTKVPYKTLLTLNNLNSNSKLNIGDTILLY